MDAQEGTTLISGHTDVTRALEVHVPESCAAIGDVLSRVGDKWSVLVVVLLRDGPRRFSELKRMIGSVSQRMLTFKLRALERDGLIKRTVFATVPPRVEYELTPLGRSLRQPVVALCLWALAHHPEIAQAQVAFDRKRRDAA